MVKNSLLLHPCLCYLFLQDLPLVQLRIKALSCVMGANLRGKTRTAYAAGRAGVGSGSPSVHANGWVLQDPF